MDFIFNTWQKLKMVFDVSMNYVQYHLKTIMNKYYIQNTFKILPIDNTHFQLSYRIHNKEYNTIINIQKGPMNILSVSDRDKDSHSESLLTKLSTYRTKSVHVTPKLLGVDRLFVSYLDGDSKEFKENDCIEF